MTGRDPEVGRPAANVLTVVGAVLVVVGVWTLLRALEVVPVGFAVLVGDWWPIVLVLSGGWMLATGRRSSGTLLALIGVLLLLTSNVPARYLGPLLLLALGVVLVLGPVPAGRRPLTWGRRGLQRSTVAGEARSGRPARSIVAVFDDTEATLDAAAAGQGVVECLAVFGDVEVEVPAGLALELRQTAVFGDVRAPARPSTPDATTVQVRATAVFGDVRFHRR